jgi:hypothetical protein
MYFFLEKKKEKKRKKRENYMGAIKKGLVPAFFAWRVCAYHAVIPAPIVYINVVAVEKLVVEFTGL